ncbi:hypothetical protein [Leptothoe spongobia]|uniref:Uncharacterized protein n=1 Tax=Leptothoe spongobia TAU-MAC 1115 TaxID=1967444 RepID=A0A947GG07_9CYAN|nr:hypothetical protein [Leptothoe spongobia]MBT9314064.1 hypothetical protein [Leptothoe spongobia TAU-MAC 1115]
MVDQLTFQIDQSTKNQQISQIVESEMFRQLKAQRAMFQQLRNTKRQPVTNVLDPTQMLDSVINKRHQATEQNDVRSSQIKAFKIDIEQSTKTEQVIQIIGNVTFQNLKAQAAEFKQSRK